MNTLTTSRRVRISLTTLALLLLTASVSYGFIWVSNLREEDEYRQMIYNISKAMGENAPVGWQLSDPLSIPIRIGCQEKTADRTTTACRHPNPGQCLQVHLRNILPIYPHSE